MEEERVKWWGERTASAHGVHLLRGHLLPIRLYLNCVRKCCMCLYLQAIYNTTFKA